jgi:hypothetical protein
MKSKNSKLTQLFPLVPTPRFRARAVHIIPACVTHRVLTDYSCAARDVHIVSSESCIHNNNVSTQKVFCGQRAQEHHTTKCGVRTGENS